MPINNVKSLVIKGINGFDFNKQYNDGLLELIRFLKLEEGENPKVTLSKVESRDSHNPFRRARPEFFHDNYKLIAKAFAVPESEKYDLILEHKPAIIFGDVDVVRV